MKLVSRAAPHSSTPPAPGARSAPAAAIIAPPTTIAAIAAMAMLSAAIAAAPAHAAGKGKGKDNAQAGTAQSSPASSPLSPSSFGAPPSAPARSVIDLAAQITLSEGKSTLVRLPYPAARLAVGDTKVADVILINPSELYMLGKASGSTNLILWNKANQAIIVDIAVGLDTLALRQQFEQLFPTEKDIRVTVSGNTVILSGTVADSVRAAQVVAVAGAYLQRGGRSGNDNAGASAAGNAAAANGGATAGTAAAITAATQPTSAAFDTPQNGQGNGGRVINMLAVAAPQQVMLEVKIAEVSKTLVDQLGASVGLAGTRGSWTYTMLSNLLSGNPGKIDAFNNSNGKFVTLDAQKNDGLVKVLAEPTVMAISGQEASFLAGGKIFIPVSQDSTSGTSRVTLEEKEYGIAVKFTPTVLEGGRINLRVTPEVSELNREGIGITATGGTATAVLPSFTTRRASTTVQLFDGQSFAIGGLIKNNVTTNIKAFPGLGEIPILGALFRSSDFQSDRTELVFVVTPHLARPLPPDHKLPTDDYTAPSRLEFFLGGKMEGAAPAPAPAPPSPAAVTAPAASQERP